MTYEYEIPRNDVFSSFVCVFAIAVISLIVTENVNFWDPNNSTNPDCVTAASLACAIYLVPATIFVKLAFSEDYEGSWSTPKRFYLIEAIISYPFFIITFLLFLCKCRFAPF